MKKRQTLLSEVTERAEDCSVRLGGLVVVLCCVVVRIVRIVRIG